MAGGTNFQPLEHETLKAMVKDTDPGKVLSRGTQLQSAGKVLKELSAALRSHIDGIHWEGPAGESFKEWAGNFHKSAAKLADYSTRVGDAMHQAGEALSTAKTAVPDLPQTEIDQLARRKTQTVPYIPSDFEARYGVGTTIDSVMKQSNSKWVTSAEAEQAQKKVLQEHQEAVNQMVKLAQAYDAVTTTLNGLETPPELQTPDDRGRGGTEHLGGGDSGGGTGSGGTYRTPHSGGGGGGGSYSPPGGGGGGGSVTPRPPAPGPQGPGSPGHTDPVPTHNGPAPLPQDPTVPGPSPAPTYPGDRPGTDLNSLPPVPTLPNQTGPFTPGGPGSLPPSVPGTGPGYPTGPGGNSSFPGPGPIPFGPGGTLPSKVTGPSRTSTFGGGNMPSKSGNPGIPSGGTVFGRDAQAGRSGGGGTSGPGGGGMHPGMGGHGGGSSRGRGLTSTGGGTVGGRKGPTTGGEFTPGGTGLRNRAGAAGPEGGSRSGQNGMMGGPGMTGGTGKSERERRNRADYLHEDEETWTSGTPQSNPNVIE
ncbi:WXG100 family type VII secretion target [Kitasatospora sp. NPDC050467]|uniref:WXG100 family type VII secretion target n=1 Tax=Kitasatospora sp. NPDC050467 TaxID=3364053 RepID=UPI0037B7E553